MLCIYHTEMPSFMIKKLKEEVDLAIPTMILDQLPNGIAAHPDIQIHPLDDHTLLCAPECFNYYASLLPPSIQLISGQSILGGTYPADCAYNAARVGNYILCNPKITDPCLLSFYQERKFQLIPIRQGYAKCNICVLNEKKILTEDVGIHKTIMENQYPIKSILLPAGEIALKGYSYGFIGGSGGCIGDKMFWFGSYIKCSYEKTIEKSTTRLGITNICLGNDRLEDFGGIILLP